ncbi:MAG: hypothetical protein E7388_06650 [Ruminococcaceae bacterium]|nr:hypothetical protein [Oscillospiraceae bacterium]
MKNILCDKSFVPIMDAVGCIPSVRMIGKSTTEITNHKGIKSFDDKQIVIVTMVGLLFVEGFNLDVAGISQDNIKITGDIRRIFYQ